LLNGEVEVYTLRDAKGEPHVTIEVQPGDTWNKRKDFGKNNPELVPLYRQFAQQMGIKDSVNNFPDWLQNSHPEIYERHKEAFKLPPSRILEIKGKSNRKPKDEYLPFVQDFVKSGNWSGINDLHNADLFDVAHYSLKDLMPKSFDASPADRLTAITAAKRAGELTKGLMTREEWEPIVKKYLPQKKAAGGAVAMAAGGQLTFARANQLLRQHVAGMAEGGAVDYESRFNEMLQKHVQGMAEGGEVNSYNSDPDMADGGRFIQAPAFADGGAVKSIWTVN
jgi:hypothetical protein